jgi:hypothetical protein
MVYKRFTDSDISQVQYVLDAASVNADVEKQYNAAMKNAISSRIGNQVNYDQRIVARGDKIRRTAMRVTKNDYHIRLDFKRFIASDALLPQSNNPDELEYLTHVKHALETNGIWLNMESNWYDTKEHAFNQDKTRFRVWLSYGKNGRAIDAPLGYVDRHQILRAVSIGKGFYAEVYHGPVAQQFDKFVTRTKINLELGKDEHMRIMKINHEAGAAVVGAAELIGVAGDLPDFSIWQIPDDLLTKALQLRNSGDMANAHRLLLLSIINAKRNLSKIEEYESKTRKGAEKAANISRITIDLLSALIIVSEVVSLYEATSGATSLSGLARQIATKKSKEKLTAKELASIERYSAEASKLTFETTGVENAATKGWSSYKAMSGY